MTFFIRHFVVFHVAALAAYTSWAFAGTRVLWLWPIFWLTLGIVEAAWLLPATQEGESLPDARRRVARAVVRDPLFIIGVLLTTFLAFQGFNGPREMSYLAEMKVWRFGAPPLAGFPSSVAPGEAIQLLAWFPPAIVAALALRHAVGTGGHRLLLHLLIWNAAVLSVSGCVQVAHGCVKIYGLIEIETQFFSSFGYPNHAGAFFTFMFVTALGFWLYERETHGAHAESLLAAAAMIFTGAILCLSRTSILMAITVLLLGGAFALIRIWRSLSLGQRIVVPFATGLIGAFMALLMLGNYPDNPVRRELGTLSISGLFTQVYERAFEMLVPTAMTIWRDNTWFGVGGWGFRHHIPLYLRPDQYQKLFVGAANVHNDFVNFLVEHGVVGLGLLLLVMLALLLPLLRRQTQVVQVSELGRQAAVRLLRGFVLCAFVLVCCHSLIDLPFRCPAVIQAVLLTLAAVGGLSHDPRADHPVVARESVKN